MSNLRSVVITNGVPSGSGTVATIDALLNSNYQAVAAGQSNTLLGASGATGDCIGGILVVPATTSPGAITIKDSSGGSQMTIFAGGSDSLSDLTPFYIPVGIRSAGAGGWYITTGANVSVIVGGQFT